MQRDRNTFSPLAIDSSPWFGFTLPPSTQATPRPGSTSLLQALNACLGDQHSTMSEGCISHTQILPGFEIYAPSPAALTFFGTTTG